MSDWPIDPAEYALGELTDSQRESAEQLLLTDPDFRSEVEYFTELGSDLSDVPGNAWGIEPPPALDMARITADPTATEPAPALAAASPTRAPFWRRWQVAIATLAVAAVGVVGTTALLSRGGSDAESRTISLTPLDGTPGTARVVLAGTRADLSASGLPVPPPGQHYEAWLANEKGEMISMGTFHVDKNGAVDAGMEIDADISKYTFVDVSLEKDDGNPAHSQISVFRANL